MQALAKDRAPILVCGDAGIARHTLLARQELHVSWCDTVEEALAIARHTQPRIVVTRTRFDDGGAEELVRELSLMNGPPVVVLLDRGEEALSARFIALGAEPIPLGRAHAVLERVGEYTGVRFAVAPRIRLQTVVEVEIGGERLVLETTDLSVTGVGVAGFPETAVGSRVHVTFLRDQSPEGFDARVMRCGVVEGVRLAALDFIEPSEAQRLWLERVICAQTADLPRAQPGGEDLFADLRLSEDLSGPLATGDIGASRVDLESFLNVWDPAVADLADVVQHLSQGRVHQDELIAPWIVDVATVLTELERNALAGRQTPQWARWCPNVRLKLARHRHDHPRAPLPPELSEPAYQLFQALPRLALPGDDRAAAEIATVRAVLLREILTRENVPRVDADAFNEAPTEDISTFQALRRDSFAA